MRVDNSNSSPVQGSDVQGTKHARKAHDSKGTDRPEGAEHAGTSSTKAEVSDRAREMAAAKSAASDAPDVREDRIAELKARIAAGKYDVDHHAVADRMVDDHIRMSGIG